MNNKILLADPRDIVRFYTAIPWNIRFRRSQWINRKTVAESGFVLNYEEMVNKPSGLVDLGHGQLSGYISFICLIFTIVWNSSHECLLLR